MFACLLALFFMLMGASFFTSFIGVRLGLAEAPKWVLGMAGASYFFGMTFGSFHSAKFISRVGYIRAYTTFASIFLAIVLFQGMVFEPYLWILLRIILGYCLGAIYVVIESWLLNYSKHAQNRMHIVSLYTFSLYMSQVFSQYIFRFIDNYTSLIAYIIVGFFVSLSILPIAMTHSSYPSFDGHKSINLRETFEKSHSGFINCFGSGMINGSIYSFLPYVFYKGGYDNHSMATLLAVPMLGGVLFQFVLGRLSNYIDRRRVLLLIYACAIPLSLIAMFFYDTRFLVFVLFFMGGFLFSVYPISMAHTCDCFEKKDYTVAIQTLGIVYGAGAVVGPTMAGLCLSFFGDRHGLFLWFIIASILLGSLTIMRLLLREGIPQDEKVGYISIQSTTPVTGELDPRTEEEE